ncbi:hypothetical protein BSFP_068670 [Burkholderia stabilis]|uniref:Uncharacterized protein n=1 Tax=Burkholderia stabilis TaxID=95485 RepID=A0A1Y1BVH2_9BURK|nr:hypothetical protein BSFP_068670 [Burkholderia stabilis]
MRLGATREGMRSLSSFYRWQRLLHERHWR